MNEETITLYRPTGPRELDLVKRSGFLKWPPRLPLQPVFNLLTTEESAGNIARDWNAVEGCTSYVTRFRIKALFLSSYEINEDLGKYDAALCISADDIDGLNFNIVGKIEVIGVFPERLA